MTMRRSVLLATVVLFQAMDARAQDLARMEQVIQSFVSSGFTGSILVARGDNVILDKAYGSPPRRQAVASITKQFTAAAILLLEERGRLRIEDPVSRHLPNTPAAWKDMTIFHLLTHTAGFAGLQTPQAQRGAPITGEPTAAGYIARVMERPLLTAPGETFSYTNTGYFILGHLMERLSGQSYERFLTDNFFTPIGLTETGPDPAAAARMSPTAIAVTPNGAAGFSSTPRDLLRWQLALWSGRVISQGALAKMTTLNKGDYGLGVYVQTLEGRRLIRHGGGAPAFAHLSWFPESRVSVVVLGNVPTAPAPEISAFLGTLAHGGRVILASERQGISLPPDVLARYAGTYELGGPIVIAVDGTQLVVVNGANKAPLLAESETVFYFGGSNIRIEFIRDASGAVTEMLMQSGTRQDRARRIGR